jgi:hypothetical protein
MKLRVFAMLTALGVAGGALASAPAYAGPYKVLGQPKADDKKAGADKKKEGKAAQGAAGQLNRKIRLAPKGLAWGLGVKQVSRLYDRVFDNQFLPLYKKAQPGVETKALDAELEDKKKLIKRNLVAFGNLPTGVDQTPLKGEYSYRNGESMTKVTLRSGTVRHFFFFDDKLWKIYDEHKLRKGGPLGESYDEAVKVLSKRFRAGPKKVAADFNKNQPFEEAQWKGEDLMVRAIDRGGDLIALVYVDPSVQGRLGDLRKNKLEDGHTMDSAVSDALRPKEAPPPAEEDKGKGKKKKKPKAKPAAPKAE